jgi:hypothetical protein
MSFLGIYVRDAIFGPGNPTTFNKVKENDNMVLDYPDEVVSHVVNLIKEALQENPKWAIKLKSPK